jgi:hypothetical protein
MKVSKVVDGPGVKEQFVQMFQDERTKHISIASPYFKTFGSSLVKSHWQSQKKSHQEPELKVLVSLRLDHFVLGSSDDKAIDDIFQLQETNPEAKISIRFLDELHSKIYVTNWCGVVGSANLTPSGFEGGNVEAAVVTEDENEVSKVNNEFDKAWKQSEILTKKKWESQKKKIKMIPRKYRDALQEMQLAIWKARVALTRIPDNGNDADYYSNLVECLSWIAQNNRNSSCSEKELISQLQKGDSKRISRKAIENRIEFIQEIGLIKRHNTRYRVTPLGADLDNSYDSRWRFFKLLLRWCEQNGDSQLRILLKAVDKSFTDSTSKVSIKELRKAIPASKRGDYWERPSKKRLNDEDAYEQFREKSCYARNWLKSLGILREYRKDQKKYTLGDVYKFCLLPEREKQKGTSIDERLNEIILGND